MDAIAGEADLPTGPSRGLERVSTPRGLPPEDHHRGDADGGGPSSPATASLPAELLAEARANPGGWVYEIHPDHERHGAVPPHAIRGAWKVDGDGNLTGEYIVNKKYRP